jgi:hypothetical protein
MQQNIKYGTLCNNNNNSMKNNMLFKDEESKTNSFASIMPLCNEKV